MEHFANSSKWSNIYTSLNNQAKTNEPIIFSRIPDNTSDEEIKKIIQELNSLDNFRDYSISRNSQNIKGVKYV